MPEKPGRPGATSSRAGSAPSFLPKGRSAWIGHGTKVMILSWSLPSPSMRTPAPRSSMWTASCMWRSFRLRVRCPTRWFSTRGRDAAWMRGGGCATCMSRTMLEAICGSFAASWCSPAPLWSSCVPLSTSGRQTSWSMFSEAAGTWMMTKRSPSC